MRKLLVPVFSLIVLATAVSCASGENDRENATPGAWITLFDGSGTDHWRGYNREGMPSGWVIQGDELVYDPAQTGGDAPGRDIITREKFADFELELEWSIERGGNSGIFYFVLEQPERQLFWSGPEMQILDNANHPDARGGKDGNRQAGSLYDLIPAVPQNFRGYDEWNQVRIVSRGAFVEHWQNGVKVLEYERWTPEWFDMLHDSKFRCYPEFGAVREGHIGLQDHGDVVRFRDIRIRRL